MVSYASNIPRVRVCLAEGGVPGYEQSRSSSGGGKVGGGWVEYNNQHALRQRVLPRTDRITNEGERDAQEGKREKQFIPPVPFFRHQAFFPQNEDGQNKHTVRVLSLPRNRFFPPLHCRVFIPYHFLHCTNFFLHTISAVFFFSFFFFLYIHYFTLLYIKQR